VQQGFGGDAADVQAHAAELGIAFYDDDFEAEIRSAESGAVATGACAQDDQIAIHIDCACVARCY
jgi:hypothetical protein